MGNEIRKKPESIAEENQEDPVGVSNAAPGSRFNSVTAALEFSSPGKYIPSFLFGASIILAYIYNALHAEKIVRNTDKIKQEIKELRAEYLTIKSDLELQSKQSQVTKKLEEREIKELRVPPFKITYNKKDER